MGRSSRIAYSKLRNFIWSDSLAIFYGGRGRFRRQLITRDLFHPLHESNLGGEDVYDLPEFPWLGNESRIAFTPRSRLLFDVFPGKLENRRLWSYHIWWPMRRKYICHVMWMFVVRTFIYKLFIASMDLKIKPALQFCLRDNHVSGIERHNVAQRGCA